QRFQRQSTTCEILSIFQKEKCDSPVEIKPIGDLGRRGLVDRKIRIQIGVAFKRKRDPALSIIFRKRHNAKTGHKAAGRTGHTREIQAKAAIGDLPQPLLFAVDLPLKAAAFREKELRREKVWLGAARSGALVFFRKTARIEAIENRIQKRQGSFRKKQA